MRVTCIARIAGLTLLYFLQLGSTATAQTQQTPTFRTATQLVEVDVNVTDHNGTFVSDLDVGDFEITDKGKRRPIDIAYVVRAGRVAIAGAAKAASASLPVVPPSGRRVLVFYFDTTHMNFGQLRRAGAAAEEFLKNSWHDTDLVGVVVGERMINNRLTPDRSESIAAVRRASRANEQTFSALTSGLADAGTSGSATSDTRSDAVAGEIAANLQDADKAIATGPVGPAELTTLNMLGQVIEGLARFPGRKNIVYFSGGFPVVGAMPGEKSPDDVAPVRHVAETAARADVHIYSIDIAGLDKGVGSSQLLTATQPEFSSAFVANMAHGRDPSKEDLLTYFALETGGLPFFNQNSYADALDRIHQDSSDYYVLAFRPDEKDKMKQGDFRAVRVKVSRPHLTVRARKGYVVH